MGSSVGLVLILVVHSSCLTLPLFLLCHLFSLCLLLNVPFLSLSSSPTPLPSLPFPLFPPSSSLKTIPNTPKKVPYKASNESPPLLRALYTKTSYPQPKLDLKKIDASEFMLCFTCCSNDYRIIQYICSLY